VLDLVLLIPYHGFLEHEGIAELLHGFDMLVMLLLEAIQLSPDAFEALHGELGLVMRGRRIRDGLCNSFQVVEKGVCLLACTGRIYLGTDYVVLDLGLLLRDLRLKVPEKGRDLGLRVIPEAESLVFDLGREVIGARCRQLVHLVLLA
jgi:hypothetical protein